MSIFALRSAGVAIADGPHLLGRTLREVLASRHRAGRDRGAATGTRAASRDRRRRAAKVDRA